MSIKKHYKVQWLRLSLQDLQGIATYLSGYDVEAACEVAEHIWQAGQSLAALPSRGRAGRVPETRELVLTHFPYFLVYRVQENCVQVLRIIHTSQNFVC